MTLQNLATFLRVGMHEGKGVTEYASDAGVFKTVMARHLMDLGDRDRHGGDGLELIYQQRDRADMRINRAWIAQKGANAIDTAYRALKLLMRGV